jgi:hypothetical protein
MLMSRRIKVGFIALLIAVGLFVAANLFALDSRDAAARVFAIGAAIAALVSFGCFFPRVANGSASGFNVRR